MTALVLPAVRPTRGLRRGWGEYGSMLHWHLASLRIWIPLLATVQVLAGAGMVLGFALFFHNIPAHAALFVSTGVPVVNIVMVGLILGPQLVADQKSSGGYEYLRSMPISRWVSAAAWWTVCLTTAVPAITVSLLVAWARYGIAPGLSATILPAVMLTSFAATMLGYAVAHAIPHPMVTRLVAQLFVWVVFGFSPILFPVSQMPRWLGTLNWWFPFRHMATVMRAALVSGPHPGLVSSYLMLGAWSILGAALAGRALGRRP